MNEIEITQPQIINLKCPQCTLTWMNRNVEGKFYFCYACQYILLDKQIEEIVLQRAGLSDIL
jgi:hypothetical protein